MARQIFIWFMRFGLVTSLLYSATLLSDYFEADFDTLTLLELFNEETRHFAYFGIKGDDSAVVDDAFSELSRDISDLKIGSVSCCVLLPATSNTYGQFEILIKPPGAFSLDVLYNDIQFIFLMAQAKYPSLEIHWSGLISFSHDFFHHTWKHTKKIILLSTGVVLLFGFFFTRAFGRSIDFLLIYGASLISGMLASVLFFNSVSIISLAFASIFGAVFVISMLQCLRIYRKKSDNFPLVFIVFYSLSTLLLFVLHPSLLVLKSVIFVFVLSSTSFTLLLIFEKGSRVPGIEREGKSLVPLKGSVLIFYVLIGVSLYYAVTKNTVGGTLASLHRPEKRIIDSENWLRGHIAEDTLAEPTFFTTLPYDSITRVNKNGVSNDIYNAGIYHIIRDYFLSGLSLGIIQILVISLSAVITFGFSIASHVIGVLFGSGLIVIGLCSLFGIPSGFFTPLVLSLWMTCFYPCMTALYVKKHISIYDTVCILPFLVMAVPLLMSPVPVFINAGVVFCLLGVLGYFVFLLISSSRVTLS